MTRGKLKALLADAMARDDLDGAMDFVDGFIAPLRTAWEDPAPGATQNYHEFMQDLLGKQWPALDEAIATVLEGDDRELPPMRVPKGSLPEGCPICGGSEPGEHRLSCPAAGGEL